MSDTSPATPAASPALETEIPLDEVYDAIDNEPEVGPDTPTSDPSLPTTSTLEPRPISKATVDLLSELPSTMTVDT